jgi:hypothetical protein
LDKESGFILYLTTDGRGTLRTQEIHSGSDFFSRVQRLSEIRGISDVVPKWNEAKIPPRHAEIQLRFTEDTEKSTGAEEIWAKHGYRSQYVPLSRRDNLSQITPQAKFNEIENLLRIVISECDPRRFPTIAHLFVNNLPTDNYSNAKWPPLNILLDDETLNEIRPVAASMHDMTAESPLKNVLILHAENTGSSNDVSVRIDPLVYWR